MEYKVEKFNSKCKMDNEFEGLTKEENELKDKIMKSGFTDWSKSEFSSFIKGCERFGRDDIEKISDMIGSKTKEEVEKYSKVFWERVSQLSDGERILNNIKKGELGIE